MHCALQCCVCTLQRDEPGRDSPNFPFLPICTRCRPPGNIRISLNRVGGKWFSISSMDFPAKVSCLQQLIERKMIIRCQGSVGCRLRHDLAADPRSTQYPAHEARAGERERDRSENGLALTDPVVGSPSRRFIQSDESCSPSTPIQAFELAPALGA